MKLSDRYSLAETGTGALMIDLISGSLVELNGSGRLIWQLALTGVPEASIAAALAERHAIDVDTARRHVRDALTVSLTDAPDAPPTVFNYAREGNEYIFRFRDEAVLAVDDRGERITLLALPDGASLPYLLQAVAPKLLALRGQVVLHASAVALRGYVIAFSGLSGAGKTSTARALARAGAQLICEDKLILQSRDRQTIVAPLAEHAVTEWVASTARTLDSSKHANCSGLDLGAKGSAVSLAEIGFLDVKHRTSGAYHSSSLTETETAGAVFRHGFYGSDANQDWIRHLRAAAHVGETVRGFQLAMPDGLDRLAEAAAALLRAGSLAS